MNINHDFKQHVALDTTVMDWQASPMNGVERKMLDRIGAESGHATSLVRYAPNSRFSAHTHDGGEEFFVLEGTFSDEYGDYPAGTYVRNPIGSKHTPYSKNGCTIFVKLWQFDPQDQQQSVVYTQQSEWLADSSGVSSLHLHLHHRESISLLRIAAGKEYLIKPSNDSAEVLVLSGAIDTQNNRYNVGSWIRTPVNKAIPIKATSDSEILLKINHWAQPFK